MNNIDKARLSIDGIAVFCAFDEIVPVADLKENPRNPNTHPESQIKLLAEVIKKTGWRAPITVSNLSGLIVKGHGRLYAARLAGLKSAPVEYQNFESEDEELSALLADNKLAELAEIDFSKLTELFKDFDFQDLELTGYSQSEYDDLISQFSQLNLPDEDEPAEITGKNAFTQSGDIWIAGKHRLICGDATLPETYEKLLGNEKADLIVTDPPYNVNYEGGTADRLTIQNDNMDSDDFKEFLSKAFELMNEYLRAGASFYIWHSDSERYNFQSACNNAGWQVRQCVIWVKNRFVMGRQDYQWKHEPCLYGWKSGAAHYFVDDRTLTTCFEFDSPLHNDIHPTMKPVELFAFQIGNSSQSAEIVLDSFAGSGTTLIACEKLARYARLIEIDPVYCDAIIKRFIRLYPESSVKCLRNGAEIPWAFDED